MASEDQTQPTVDDESPVPTQAHRDDPAEERDERPAEGTLTSDGEGEGEGAGERQPRQPPAERDEPHDERIEALPCKPSVAAAQRRDPRVQQQRNLNSTDATRGEPLAWRAKARQTELEELLACTPESDARTRADIEHALASVSELLTGDNDHLSEATAAAINRWLEGSKHIGETHRAAS
jgi:hypothetical protein